MNIQTSIQHRRSVRTYTGEPLKTEHISAIKHFIAALRPLYDTKVRIEMLGVLDSNSPVKLGTYGKIAGAKHFLAYRLWAMRLKNSDFWSGLSMLINFTTRESHSANCFLIKRSTPH
ncbi:nitroreductase family protein [Candidatus Symbiothrix dinenymphae]|uniref:nitroreductase family protein n=1 Tax=Candidatus Symbiothrix dinenymphae TaxID=467085 RepID=UPI000AAAD0A4|nr:nitroreductase family protein [Candidatus Symbiothrix dinenymphae]